ncbi:MAG: hypothetical protein RLZZ477_647, partial [Actinomycetota bacterium]
ISIANEEAVAANPVKKPVKKDGQP